MLWSQPRLCLCRPPSLLPGLETKLHLATPTTWPPGSAKASLAGWHQDAASVSLLPHFPSGIQAMALPGTPWRGQGLQSSTPPAFEVPQTQTLRTPMVTLNSGGILQG